MSTKIGLVISSSQAIQTTAKEFSNGKPFSLELYKKIIITLGFGKDSIRKEDLQNKERRLVLLRETSISKIRNGVFLSASCISPNASSKDSSALRNSLTKEKSGSLSC